MVTAGVRHQPKEEAQNPQLLMAQHALRGNINEGVAVARETEQNLFAAASLPPLGSDSVSVCEREREGEKEREKVCWYSW